MIRQRVMQRWTDVHMAYWQPISTAPKDGRDILVFLDGNRHDFSRIAVAAWSKGAFVEYAWDKEALRPTHWMPLPAPPVDKAISEAQREQDS